MQFFSWHRLRSRSKFLKELPLKYLILLLMALWISVAIPGCSLFQSNLPTASPQPTESASQTGVSQATASPQRFDGVTINVITHDAAIHTGVERNIAGFESLTGAKVRLTGVPVKDFYQILQTNWSGSASEYDAAVILPQWLIDFSKSRISGKSDGAS